MRISTARLVLVIVGLAWVGCGTPPAPVVDAGVPVDARTLDARVETDAEIDDDADVEEDAGEDAGADDAGPDAEIPDAHVPDAGADGGAEMPDAGADGGTETSDAGPSCGDGTIGGTEDCDGSDLDGETCVSMGFGGGALACTSGCTLDTSACDPCGNGVLDAGEACDGTALGAATCASEGFDGGALACSATCTLVTTACFDCGDGVVNGTEQCDGTALAGATCGSRGFAGGALGCTATCTFDTSMCTTCGNGTLDAGEICDGTALGGATCGGSGFDGGTLGCSASCTLDTSMCTDCGDGAIEGMEQCDGAALGGATCASRPGGFTGGTLACDASCVFDTAGCTACGDGVAQGTEACDGTDLRGETCATRPGFASGTLGCTACGFDTSGCSAVPAPSAAGQIVITEIMADPTAADDADEWFEIHNGSAGSLNLSGCRFTGTGSASDTFVVGASLVVAPGAYATFARSTSVAFTPSYVWPSGFVLANTSDGISLDCGGTVIDLVAYDGGVTFPDPTGASISLAPTALDAASNDVGFRWCQASSAIGTSADRGTPGAANDACETFPIGFCRLQFPGTIAGTTGGSTTVYGRVYAAGLTDDSGVTDTHPQLLAEVGYGPDGSDPALGGWTWTRAGANAAYGGSSPGYEANNDEYEAALVHPAAGTYDYAYRFSGNRGETWLHCDTSGATSASEYATADAGQMTTTMGCGPVINEVQVAGGSANDEFVELYNPCTTDFDLDGHRLVYRAAAGTSDTGLVSWTTSTVIPAGAHFLIAQTSYDGTETRDATYGGSIAAAGGGVALRSGPANTGFILDSVGYGTATNPFVEGTAAAAPAASSSIARIPNGADTGVNSADFAVDSSPTPRASNAL